MDDNRSLTINNLSDKVKEGFLNKVKEQYVEGYAQKALLILEDRDKLKKALDKVEKCIADIEEGDYSSIDKYLKLRRRLEEFDDEEL